MKHALDDIEIALMHAVDADEAGAALWHRHCAVLDAAFGPVCSAVAHLNEINFVLTMVSKTNNIFVNRN